MNNIVILVILISSVYMINIIAYFIGQDPKTIMVLCMPFYFGATSIHFKRKYADANKYPKEVKYAKSMILLTVITSVLSGLILMNF